MPNPLVIKAYDPQWPILFEELRVKFSELLGNMVSATEHVGSTSVPGLAAKPIIDLDVLLASAAYLPETIRRSRLWDMSGIHCQNMEYGYSSADRPVCYCPEFVQCTLGGLAEGIAVRYA